MRSSCERRLWFPERNDSYNAPFQQVEFRDRGSIPQRNESTLPVFRHHRRVGQRSRNSFHGRKVKRVNDLAVRGIEKYGFIGVIVGDEQSLLAVAQTYAQPRRVRDILIFSSAKFPCWDFRAGRHGQESLRRNPSVLEFVNRNAVAGAS